MDYSLTAAAATANSAHHMHKSSPSTHYNKNKRVLVEPSQHDHHAVETVLSPRNNNQILQTSSSSSTSLSWTSSEEENDDNAENEEPTSNTLQQTNKVHDDSKYLAQHKIQTLLKQKEIQWQNERRELTNELINSTKEFEETISSYETVITNIKSSTESQINDLIKKFECTLEQERESHRLTKDELDNVIVEKEDMEQELGKLVIDYDKLIEEGMEKYAKEELAKVTTEFETLRQESQAKDANMKAHIKDKELQWNEERVRLEEEIKSLKQERSADVQSSSNALQMQLLAAMKEAEDMRKFNTTLRSEHNETITQLESELSEERDKKTEYLRENISLQESYQQQEDKITSLQTEVNATKEELQKVSNDLNAAQEELQRVTTELDDALTYTKNMNTEHEETTSRLNKLQIQLKSVESSKEENQKMYERDMSAYVEELETLRVQHSDARKHIETLEVSTQSLQSQLEKSDKDHKAHIKSKSKELLQSTQAFEETISSYNSMIAKSNESNEKMKHENKILKTDLDKVKNTLQDREFSREVEINAYKQVMDALKKKCTDETTIIRHLEQDKNKLQMQVKRLQSNFQDVMSQFEKTSNTQEEEIRTARLNSDEQQKKIDSLQDEVTRVEEALKVSREELQRANVELDEMLNYTQQTTRRLNLDHEQQTLALRHEFKEETSKLNKIIQSLETQVKSFESSKAASIDKQNDAHQKLDSLSELISTLKCTLENEKESAQTLLGSR